MRALSPANPRASRVSVQHARTGQRGAFDDARNVLAGTCGLGANNGGLTARKARRNWYRGGVQQAIRTRELRLCVCNVPLCVRCCAVDAAAPCWIECITPRVLDKCSTHELCRRRSVVPLFMRQAASQQPSLRGHDSCPSNRSAAASSHARRWPRWRYALAPIRPGLIHWNRDGSCCAAACSAHPWPPWPSCTSDALPGDIALQTFRERLGPSPFEHPGPLRATGRAQAAMINCRQLERRV